MTIEVFAANFVDALSFEVLIAWADMMEVAHDEKQWLDDEWPDKESSLRAAVAEAILKVGTKTETEPLGKTMADYFDKLLSKNPGNPMPLGST